MIINRSFPYILLTLIAIIISSCSSDKSVQSSVPDAPSDLTGEAVGTYTVQLYWSDNSDNEDRFIIYRSIGGLYENAGHTGANAGEYLDEIPVSCVEAAYYIVAENESGQSSFSNRITVPLICGGESSEDLKEPAR